MKSTRLQRAAFWNRAHCGRLPNRFLIGAISAHLSLAGALVVAIIARTFAIVGPVAVVERELLFVAVLGVDHRRHRPEHADA